MNLDIPEGYVADQSFARSFAAKKAEILARAEANPPAPNLDVNAAGTVMLTVAANIHPLLPAIQAQLPTGRLDLIMELEVRAEALLFTQGLYTFAFESANNVEVLARQVYEQRRILTAELTLAVMRGVIPDGAVSLSGTSSYQDAAQDVRAMSSLLLANWDIVLPAIGGRRERITGAMSLADELVKEIAKAERIKDRLAGPAALRAGAFQLSLESYRAADRAVSFLRYDEDDADKFVPTIYVGGGRPRKRPKADGADAAAPTPAGSAAATAGVPNVPTGGAASGAAANVPSNKVKPSGGFDV